ncbi:MAG: hypothetical protein MRZ79_01640, partial [Bacteroidia bacterium]|nr:hypothetical protein [Bacteroidia bacterium]
MKYQLFIIFLLGNYGIFFAQTPLFQDDSPLELTLTADLNAFTQDRSLKAEYYPAELSYTHNGESVNIPMKIKVRGRFRRDSLVCNFPPVRFNFKKGELPSPFEKQDKLKVVTHCQDDETILKEYYIYKAYNLFTPESFLVRLAKITYVDKAGILPSETHFAFLIESEEHMAKRNKAKPVDEKKRVYKEDVNRLKLGRVYMFNYMISNYDFEVAVRQNMKIMARKTGLPIVVPYDFDWAGIVGAQYTLEGNERKHPYFLRRKFKRFCMSEEEWTGIIDS